MQTVIFSDVLASGYGKSSGPYKIATELRKSGFTCQVVDFFSYLKMEEIFAVIDRFVDKDTIWVGISTTFFFTLEQNLDKMAESYKNDYVIYNRFHSPVIDYDSAYPFDGGVMREIFAYIKSKNPQVKIVVGGARASNAQFHDAKLKKIYADYYIQGYADDSIVVFTKWLHDQSNPRPRFDINYKNLIKSNQQYEYQDFNTSRLKFLKSDIIEPDEFLPIEIARGCIFKCKYCNFPMIGKKRGEYTKTKETLIEEFTYNYETFGTTKYMFMDETTNDSIEKIEFLHDVISDLPFKIEWGGYARLELHYKHPEMAALMKETGLSYVQYGIETFNKKSGEVVGKGMDPEKSQKILHDLKSQWKQDVKITSGFIVGLPYETKESLKYMEDYFMSDECSLDAWNLIPLIVTNGTESLFGQNPEKYGYSFTNLPNDTPYDWHNAYNNMTFRECLLLSHRIKSLTAHKNTTNTWINMRLRNIGYTKVEADSMSIFEYNLNLVSITDRIHAKKAEYLKKLLT